ncbi:tryptophan-rich sensory protein [Pseudoflavonifractor sp. AF19-9AC]|uniref:TspO/MBR family protein n=1 Tax=Pseudoflavonifractor sp. AF19-9AC TaxID=2292244 RepID=UPI000E524366|nr:TspO/MBR family protein [Pseudoflavonifractor sp. AF19-9AC]RHR08241.1 tryptophan-rich sensory protein [Pseudoflavonifractor sp. AF19-9AC]
MKKLGFIFFPLLALGAGMLSGYLAAPGLASVYPLLEKSALTPPGEVFPVVWTVLYLLMGIGLAMVVKRGGKGTGRAALLWCAQLAVNVSWSLLFFGAGAYLEALICLGILWMLILLMILAFHSVSRWAAWIQIPYFLWVSFAGYLNLVVWQLNP